MRFFCLVTPPLFYKLQNGDLRLCASERAQKTDERSIYLSKTSKMDLLPP